MNQTKDSLFPERTLAIGLTALCIAMLVAIFAFIENHTIGTLSSDDSFYYFKTAFNITEGNGATFDGINPTNGFHPLWMLILLPIYTLTQGNLDLAFKFIYGLLTIQFCLSAYLVYRIIKRFSGTVAATTTILLLLNPVVFNQFFNGLESGLLIFLILILFSTALKTDIVSISAPLGKRLLLGFLLGLIFLCRLDTAFMMIGLAISTLIFFRLDFWKPNTFLRILQTYLPVISVFILTAAPYFIWNYTTNGQFMPISGAIKTSFPDITFNTRYLTFVGWMPYTLFILLSLIALVIDLTRSNSRIRQLIATKSQGNSAYILVIGFWIGCFLHFTYSIAYTKWGTFYWHFASYIPCLLLFASILLSTAFRIFKNSTTFRVLTSILIVASGLGLQWFTLSEKFRIHQKWHQAAMWVRENTPPDAVLGMTDCGYFGYFNQRTTVNLDGLINGYAYQEALASDRETMLAYLTKTCGIDYICDYEVPIDGRMEHRVLMNRLFHKNKKTGKKGFFVQMPMRDYVFASKPYEQYAIKQGIAPPIKFYIWKFDSSKLEPIR